MSYLKEHIGAFIVGVALTITVLSVYGVFQIRSVAIDAEVKVNQVIQLINQAQQQK